MRSLRLSRAAQNNFCSENDSSDATDLGRTGKREIPPNDPFRCQSRTPLRRACICETAYAYKSAGDGWKHLLSGEELKLHKSAPFRMISTNPNMKTNMKTEEANERRTGKFHQSPFETLMHFACFHTRYLFWYDASFGCTLSNEKTKADPPLILFRKVSDLSSSNSEYKW